MHALLGCLMGFSAGLGIWWAAWAWQTEPKMDPVKARPGGRGALVLAASLGLWGAYAGWQTAHTAETALAVSVTGALLLISLVDLRVRRVPHALLLLLLALALAQALWLGKPAPRSALAGMAVGGATAILVYLGRRGAVGMGDLLLVAGLGALLGVPEVFPALAAGVLLGGAGALWLLATQRAGRRDRFPYAPYLALGGWLVWSWSFGLWP